ncbi:hypothetical protein [Thauera linaloolentis]|nr:hypothetical protein [Thauera linaloolentis]
MTDTKPAATATTPKKRPTLRFRTGSDIQAYRKKVRLNQAKF